MMWKVHLVLCACALSVAALAVPASSHTATGGTASNFYLYKWVDDVTPAWRFTSGYPSTSAWRARIRDGATSWNAQGQPLQWHEVTPDLGSFDPSICSASYFYQQNGIHYASISGAPAEPLAVVQPCVALRNGVMQLYTVNMIINKNYNTAGQIYSGTGTPAPTQYDLWSVASHEWGHMAGSLFGSTAEGDGQGHFLESDNTICGALAGAARQTMCPQVLLGDTQQRDLEGDPYYHDTHTFFTAY